MNKRPILVRPGRYRLVDLPAPPAEWISTARLAADSVTLAGLLPADCAGIVGIPRSGMVPAAICATHLHLPLWELTPSGPVPLGAGSRGGGLYRPSGSLAVVDDTSYSGAALALARQRMRGLPAIYAVVYALPMETPQDDLFVRQLAAPHLLEWNFVNNGPFWGAASADAGGIYGTGCGVDLDGIIVHDDESGGRPGTPYMVPRAHPVRLIATARPESARVQTEAMLRSLGVRWERLEMLPDGVPLTMESAAAHKARHYAATSLGFFLESDPAQAETIFRAAGKPVICPSIGRIFQ